MQKVKVKVKKSKTLAEIPVVWICVCGGVNPWDRGLCHFCEEKKLEPNKILVA